MKNKYIKISILFVFIGIIFIVVGASYARYKYVIRDSDINEINVGEILFNYDDTTSSALNVVSYPLSDSDGLNSNSFNFNIKSKTLSNLSLPYTVTLRINENILNNYTKVNLSNSVNDGLNYANTVLVNSLTNYSNQNISIPTGYIEKVLYTGTVPQNSNNYINQFNFRIWVSDIIDLGEYSYVLKTSIGSTPLDFDTLKTNNAIISENKYNSLTAENKALYDQIKYINRNTNKIITESQVNNNISTIGFTQSTVFNIDINNPINTSINVYANN